MNHDVFISYSSQNSKAAQAICHTLEQHKIRCWIAPRDIPSGSEYSDIIDAAIINCKVFIIIFSESSSTSLWVKGELNAAFTEQKYIIPFRIDDTRLTGGNRVILNQFHWIDAYPDYEQKFAELVESVSRIIGKPKNEPQQVNIPPVANLEQAIRFIGRNEPCPCGSGKKYKNCHGSSQKE
mgnify:FL=1|jgi:hypothetical protein|nr:MAG TPA: TIR domain [Caudoviricetes sp.]